MTKVRWLRAPASSYAASLHVEVLMLLLQLCASLFAQGFAAFSSSLNL